MILRFILEKQIFTAVCERLITFISVSRLDKRKKTGLLCLAVHQDTLQPNLSLIKHAQDKDAKDVVKRKRSWFLQSLRQVDGKISDYNCLEFDFHLEKVYRWVANSVDERNSFLCALWTLCGRHLRGQLPEFINFPDHLFTTSPSKQAGQTADMRKDVSQFQSLTDQEEEELLALMSSCQSDLADTQSFSDKLANELLVLDGANVHSIVTSEQQASLLINAIQKALDEIGLVESYLDKYDKILAPVRASLREMDLEKERMELSEVNYNKLLQTLDASLPDISAKERRTLLDPQLTTASGVVDACEAASALVRLLEARVSGDSVLRGMKAVVQQDSLTDKFRSTFTQCVQTHLKHLIIHIANNMRTSGSDSVKVTSHSSCHRQLLEFRQLFATTKLIDSSLHATIMEVYLSQMSACYCKEMQLLFNSAISTITLQKSRHKRKESFDNIPTMLNTSSNFSSNTSTSLSTSAKLRNSLQSTVATTCNALNLASDPEVWSKTIYYLNDSSTRVSFDKTLNSILSGLEPLFKQEEEFISAFFDISDIDETIQQLFTSLPVELNNFLSHFQSLDSLITMHVLVRLSEHVTLAAAATAASHGTSPVKEQMSTAHAPSTVSASNFLHRTLTSTLLTTKQNFDRFMHAQVDAIQKWQPANRHARCGVIPFVENFREFSLLAESVFRESSRRVDLERWYGRIVQVIVDQVTVIGQQHTKSPVQVVQIENFHHLHAQLKQLKISVLDAERDMLKTKYSEALRQYVVKYFERPLIKLNQFFEGVQQKVAQGVRETEVGFQLVYSKQELRRVLQEYPGKTVKKALEQLYSKVEKHFTAQSSLLQVVWRSMQEEFISQYKAIDEMISRCYPGSKLTLEFSIGDVLKYFSDIARQH